MAVAVIAVATLEVAAMAVDQARVAVVAGATGLVGQAVLAALLTAEKGGVKGPAAAAPLPDGSSSDGHGRICAPAAVHVLYAQGRRAPTLHHPLLHLHAVDFADLPHLPQVDDVYITLGTTMAAAGSESAFRAVDYDAVLGTARAARAAGATRCGVVSAMGANEQSRFFYNRVIARPSLLIGKRSALYQPARPAESVALKLFQWLNPVIPAHYRARPAAEVGYALVLAVQNLPPGQHVLSGNALQVG